MPDSGAWSSLPHYWLHIQLPGYRELPEHHTYEGSRLEALPPIPIELDDDCAWLMRHGTPHARGGLNRYELNLQPQPSTVEKLALGANLELPRSFRRFMCSTELQERGLKTKSGSSWKTKLADDRLPSWNSTTWAIMHPRNRSCRSHHASLPPKVDLAISKGSTSSIVLRHLAPPLLQSLPTWPLAPSNC
jgi:hypothetical protein